MSESIRIHIQKIVDTYKTIIIVIGLNKNTLNYEVEVYNKGVKLIVGRDRMLLMSLIRALSCVVKLIDDKYLSRELVMSGEEINKFLDTIRDNTNKDIEVFANCNLKIDRR